MTVPLYAVIQINYPTANLMPEGNVQVGDRGDGNGAVIVVWNVPGVVQPTPDILAAFQSDPNTVNAYQAQLNVAINASIISQLEAIDLRSIRPLRESDSALLATLAAQAVALRAQLLPTTAAGVLAASTAS